jgi:signal transduction histidine kinase
MQEGFDEADQVRHLEDRLRTLSGALRAFAEATTDYERLLEVVARTLAEVVKDGCVVRLLSEGGWLSPVAVELPVGRRVQDPEMVARLHAHIAAPHNVSEQGAARKVIETGEPLLVPRLDIEQMRSTTSPEIVQVYETIGIHSLLLVALRVRGESIGLLSLVRFDPDSPPFGDADLGLAQALADHAALAISNARLLRSALRELADRERAEAALRKSEEQLLHAQKMEAVGRLAAGVAHDFNNVLSVILSNAQLIVGDLDPKEPLRADVEQINNAALRAASLTRQLLAFSRQQVLEAKVLNLNQVVRGFESILRRLLGADVELTTLLASNLWNVRADEGQIEQIAMNLAVNARDAMPEGGKFTIETANVELDDDYARAHPEVSAGAYVMLATTDTGMGMDRKTQARIFEPFFTTKEPGRGTGLGLATVFGIVKQSGGHIWVYSEPGNGSTFKLYFPKVTAAAQQTRPSERPPRESYRGDATILLVEDDEPVRVVARNILRRNGYVVLEASNAGEALLLSQQHGSPIHLLLTDIVLPRMSGQKLADRLKLQRPEMLVLFMSGYTNGGTLQHGVPNTDATYVQKPLTPSSLARKVREVLRGPYGDASN